MVIRETTSTYRPAYSNAFLSQHLLLLSGDVELNPGPYDYESEKPLLSTTSSEVLKTLEKSKPQGHIGEIEDYKHFCSKVKFVILTITDDEFGAATTIIKAPTIDRNRGDPNRATIIFPGVYVGMIGGHRVGLLQPMKGGPKCRAEVTRYLEIFPEAKYLISAGVCYGFPQAGVKVGDVIISSAISDHGDAEVTNATSIIPRGDCVSITGAISSIFCTTPEVVKPFKVTTDRAAQFRCGTIVSSFLFIEDEDYRDKLFAAHKHRRPLGGEKEGSVLLSLRGHKKSAIIIKGVTDFGDGERNKEWQFICAKAAFHYLECKLIHYSDLSEERGSVECAPNVSSFLRFHADSLKDSASGPSDVSVASKTESSVASDTESGVERPLYSNSSLEAIQEIKNSVPQPQIRSAGIYKDYCSTVKFIILTINNNEFEAATTFIKAPDVDKEKGDPNRATVIYPGVYVGTLGGHRVGLLKTTAAGSECKNEVIENLAKFPHAKYIIAAGVCYGFPQSGTKLGDVVISNAISDHGDARINDDGSLTPRGNCFYMKKEMRHIFCTDPGDVEPFRITEDRVAEYKCGTVVSSFTLVDNKDYRNKVYAAHKRRRPLAGEMEGGVLLSVRGELKRVIIIKGITDLADGQKTKEWQYIVAKAAFHYLEQKLLKYTGIFEEENSMALDDDDSGDDKSVFLQGSPVLERHQRKSPRMQRPARPKLVPQVSDVGFYEHYCILIKFVILAVGEGVFRAASSYFKAPYLLKQRSGVNRAVMVFPDVYVGILGGHRVGLIKVTKPLSECREEVSENLERFPEAKYLIAAGVCYGFPQAGTKLGDVIISSAISDHGNAHVHDGDDSAPRGDYFTITGEINSIFCTAPDVIDPFHVAEGVPANYKCGTIVSSLGSVDSEDHRDKIYDAHKHRRPLAGETEGGVLLSFRTSKRSIIVIKEVTGLADGKEDKHLQFACAKAAFHYLEHKLSTFSDLSEARGSVEVPTSILLHSELSDISEFSELRMASRNGTGMASAHYLSLSDSFSSGKERPLYTISSPEILEDIKRSKPQAQIRSAVRYEEYCKLVEFVMLTVNNNEFEAATTFIKAPDIDREKGDPNRATVIYPGVYVGTLGGHRVGLLKTTAAGSECKHEVTENLARFPNAKYVVAVGVCYGFPQAGTDLGDILISSAISDHGDARINDDGSLTPRGNCINMKNEMRRIFWEDKQDVEPFQITKRRHAVYKCGTIVSSFSLVDNVIYRDKVYAAHQHRQPLGGEMEGGVLLSLRDGKRLVIIIKGVTDLADGQKTKEWQFIVAKAAFHYVEQKLLKFSEHIRNDGTVLTEGHLWTICKQLEPCQKAWSSIAAKLGFTSSEISAIETDATDGTNDTEMDRLIANWLSWRLGDDRGTREFPKLKVLQEALDDTDFGHIKLEI